MTKYRIEALFYNIGWEIPNEVDFPVFDSEREARIFSDDPRFEIRPVPAQQQSAGTEWTGAWLVKDSDTGQVLHRIHGIGNVQADANRHAMNWLRTQDPEATGNEIEVVPEMA